MTPSRRQLPIFMSIGRWISSVLLAMVVSIPATGIGALVEYTYDENGRLVGVYAPSGDAAQYVYDAAGNITQIKRFTSTALSIIEFTPNSGASGTAVTIWGTGFSTTPANNAVTFNGTAATVSAAAANKLTVSVPSGATTGPIGITVGTSSATSATNFTVTSATGAPTITSFSPAAGAPGASVTISGTNFDTTASLNNTRFNTSAATVATALSTALSTSVPTNAGSGKITVRTINGTATSANDFVVPFGTYAAADIVSNTRGTVDGTANSFSVGTAGKVGYVLFDGVQGQNLGIGISSLTHNTLVSVLRPDNVAMRPDVGVNSPGGSLHIPTLTMTGTYTLAIAPNSPYTATGTVTISTDVTATLGSPGTITNTGTTRDGQGGRFTFQGTVGQNLALYVFAMASATQPFTVTLYDPYGFLLVTYNTNNTAMPSAFIQAPTLTSTGTHTVTVTPSLGGFGTYSIQYGMPDLAVTSFTASAPYPNQDGSYSVPVTATVTNQGTVGISRNFGWKDSSYFSTDGTLDTSDRLAVATPRNVDTASGSSYTVNQTAIVPAGTATGTYTLFFKTDAGDNGSTYTTADSVKESNETNNTASASITIPGLPDLTVSNLSVGTITGNQDASYNVPFSFTVTNSGASPAKATWYDECYLSSDSTLGSGDKMVGYFTRSTDLAVGASYTAAMTCLVPGSTAAGSYTMFAKADSSDFGATYVGNQRLAESNETNNTASTAATLPAQADIAIVSSSVGTITVNTNGSYNIPVTFTVQNVGTGLTAKSPWFDMCYLSTDTTLGTTDDYLGNTYHSTSLAAGAQYNVSMTCVTPTTTTAGSYTLFLKADGYNSGTKYSASEYLTEPNEANNVAAISITLPTKP